MVTVAASHSVSLLTQSDIPGSCLCAAITCRKYPIGVRHFSGSQRGGYVRRSPTSKETIHLEGPSRHITPLCFSRKWIMMLAASATCRCATLLRRLSLGLQAAFRESSGHSRRPADDATMRCSRSADFNRLPTVRSNRGHASSIGHEVSPRVAGGTILLMKTQPLCGFISLIQCLLPDHLSQTRRCVDKSRPIG